MLTEASQCNRKLSSLAQIKAFWLVPLQQMRLRWPTITVDLARASARDLQECVTTALRIEHKLSQESNVSFRSCLRLESSGDISLRHSVTALWFLRDGVHLISILSHKYFILWDILPDGTREPLFRFSMKEKV